MQIEALQRRHKTIETLLETQHFLQQEQKHSLYPTNLFLFDYLMIKITTTTTTTTTTTFLTETYLKLALFENDDNNGCSPNLFF
jgi:hypothetical protein